MHIIPLTGCKLPTDGHEIQLNEMRLPATTMITALEVSIYHRLSFGRQAGATSADTRSNTRMLVTISHRKGAAPSVLHHLATTMIISGMLSGSKAWWTQAAHIFTQLGPVHHNIASTITEVPRWTGVRTILKKRASSHSPPSLTETAGNTAFASPRQRRPPMQGKAHAVHRTGFEAPTYDCSRTHCHTGTRHHQLRRIRTGKTPALQVAGRSTH